MLTGRMAFGGVNLREVLARQAAGQPTPIAELRPDVPPPVTAIVTRATAKRAEDRYQTAGEMATDLRLAHRLELLLRRREPLLAARDHCDVEALACERPCGRASDAGRAARHDNGSKCVWHSAVLSRRART